MPTAGCIYWTPTGELLGKGEVGHQRRRDLAVGLEPRQRVAGAHDSRLGEQRAVARARSRSRCGERRRAPRTRRRPNEFNGVLALVVDINRFVEVYLGPAMNEMSDARLVVGLATPEFGVRMGPGREGVAPTPADAHNHAERQGTMILDDADGRRLHAWAKLDAADETWLVASSAPLQPGGRADPAIGDGAAGADRDAAGRGAAGRLADRAARAAGPGGAAPARAPARRIAEDGGDRQARRRRRARLQQHAHRDPRLREHDPGGRAAEVGDSRSGAADSPRRRERRGAHAEAARVQPQAGPAVRSG